MFPHGERRSSWAHCQRCSSYTQDQLGRVEASIGGYAQAVQVKAGWAGYVEGKRIPCFMAVSLSLNPYPENLVQAMLTLISPLQKKNNIQVVQP